LKSESKKAIENLISEMTVGNFQNTNLENLLSELAERLNHTKGKRVYGYLPPNVKLLVDSIVDELCKMPSVDNAYQLWYQTRNEVIASYKDIVAPTPPLSQQKEFKSIKNHIIYEADKLSKGEISLTEFEKIEISEPTPMEDDIADEYAPQTEDIEKAPTKPYVNWADEYKQAREFLLGTDKTEPNFEKALELLQAESQNGNMLAVFDLGRMYADGLGVEVDNEKSQQYYKQALDGFTFIENRKPWKYLEYRIGKMYAQGLGTAKDDAIAAKWFEKSANQKYKFAEYSLGGLYYHGKGVEQSYEKALKLYQRSANQNFPYADYEVAKMLKSGVGTEIDEKLSDYHFRKAFVGFISMEKQSHDDKLQYRIGSILLNGIGTEKDVPKAKEYFEKSAKLGNSFACYSLAKIILSEENPTQTEIEKAVLHLQTACDNGNQFAEYYLGKVYIEGKYVQQNIDKALELFTSSADKGNEYAQYQLGKIYITGELLLKDTEKAIHYLTQSAEQGNQFSQYALGKLYLMGKDVAKDKETAIKWFTLSAEQGNEYAQFFLDNMDKWRDPSVSSAAIRLLQHISKIFEDKQPQPQKQAMDMKID
ncbi:MAG: SEL1-like repeat protein, partial [Oscillospiraceae bacterium]